MPKGYYDNHNSKNKFAAAILTCKAIQTFSHHPEKTEVQYSAKEYSVVGSSIEAQYVQYENYSGLEVQKTTAKEKTQSAKEKKTQKKKCKRKKQKRKKQKQKRKGKCKKSKHKHIGENTTQRPKLT